MRARSGLAAVVAVASMIILPIHGQDANQAGAAPTKVVVRGAGATFPAPLYEKWIMTFRQQNPDLVITYDVVGSGEGENASWPMPSISGRATRHCATSSWPA